MIEKEFLAIEPYYYDMISFIREEMHNYMLNDTAVKKVNVIIEEIITNIINYAYTADYTGKKFIIIGIDFNDGNLKLIFTDAGIGYDFHEKDKGPMQEPRIGGLGIFFVRKFADSINIKRINNRNILEVVLNNVSS